jgi:hypothetical protein
MSSSDWADRRLRHKVQLEAEIIDGEGASRGTIVSDLSLDGCRIVGWFRIGELIDLQIPRIGRVQGQVRWAMNGQAGIRFRSLADRQSARS